MPRRPRIDFPGAWHHVTNRGISKRPIFERAEDVRYFQSRMARAVRRGELEVHAFSHVTTHFHLLVRSLIGRLDRAMKRIQGEYSRYFNRRRRRDGTLYRGRYFSSLVDSTAYMDNVVRYIDGNAVEAGLVPKPGWHPNSSAYWYRRDEGPPWLTRDWVQGRAVDRCNAAAFGPDVYEEAFRPRFSPSFEQWIVERLAGGERAPDPLDDLIDAAPPKLLAWMQRKAELADGGGASVRMPLVPSEDLADALRVGEARLRTTQDRRAGRACDITAVAFAGLLRDVGGLTLAQIALLAGCSPAGVAYRVKRHRALLHEERYGTCIAQLVREAFRGIR